MEKLYIGKAKVEPYLTKKIPVKQYMERFSNKVKGFHNKMSAVRMQLQLGPGTLNLEEFVKSWDNCNEDPPIPAVDVKLMRVRPIAFEKPTFTSKALEDMGFASLALAKERILEENASLKKKGRRYVAGQHLKYRGVRWLNDGRGPKNATDDVTDLIANEDYYFVVRVYRPFHHFLNSKVPEVPRMQQELVLLGSQRLSDLRALIKCAIDRAVPHDISENPFEQRAQRGSNVYKSGFIYVNDTFYNDFTHPGNVDYSAPIIKWAEGRGIGPFKTASIETRICDVTLKLGYPYVYQHQADCEHIFVFTDLRLLSAGDPRCSKYYPYLRTFPMQRGRYCMICGKFMAKWLTEGANRLPVDPCYFCDYCFKAYNYVDGKKVGQFKAFMYVDKTTLV